MKKQKRIALILFIMSISICVWQAIPLFVKDDNVVDPNEFETMAYTEFKHDLDDKTVDILYYTANLPDMYVKKVDGTYYRTINPEYNDFKLEMLNEGIIVRPTHEIQPNGVSMADGIRITIMISAGMMAISFLFRYFMYSKQEENNPLSPVLAGGNGKGGSVDVDIGIDTQSIKKFDDVAGLYEVKKDVKCLVDFIKNNDKYNEAGATLPKGVIFYGPPGTGKTLLAKAIAGEAGVPFHYMSGSDFVEMYVGMGAKRVRELFATAKKNTPCIIFIDEIDAIGGQRGHDENGEDRKTLNALLTEMDGFNNTTNILVIAATNRLEDLDSALVRPGRFTNKFCIPLPETSKERLEVIKLYSKNKKFAEDVDLKELAKMLIGFSPAAIEALLNEAAIISVQDKKRFIDNASIEKAMFKSLTSGHIKENQEERDKKELNLVAWHEAGHALVGKLNGKSIPKVTILSTTTGAGGVTFSTPKTSGLFSVNDLKAEVSELYAGRAAELMLMKDKNKITTGASNDIEKATNIIQGIVTSYGMSEEFGMLNLNQLNVNQNKIIEQEVKLAKEIEDKTVDILTKNYDVLKTIAESLIERETLYEADLDAILKGKKIEPIDMSVPVNKEEIVVENTVKDRKKKGGLASIFKLQNDAKERRKPLVMKNKK